MMLLKKKGVNWVYRMHYKKRNQFLLSGGVSFLFSNLYINCKREKLPVQSICQLTCFHLWVSISVGEGDAKIGCQFEMLFVYLYLNINFIHHLQCHFNFIRAKWPLYKHLFFYVHSWLYHFDHCHYIWWCCPATVADASKCEAEEGLTCSFHVVFHCVGIAALSSCQPLWWLSDYCHCFDFLHKTFYPEVSTNLYTCRLFCQWLLVWCFTLVLNYHNHQPKQPQN